MRRFSVAFAFVATTALAAPTPVDVDVTLRDTGYLLGDLVDETVALHLSPTQRIDADSLPVPGRVQPWLEVRRTVLGARDADGVQTLVVTYQTFAEAEQPTRAPIPAFTIRISDGADVIPVEVPERSFLMSPGLPSPLTDRDRETRPSPTPQRLSETGALAGIAASAMIAIALGMFLLWRYDRLPFLPRNPGPLVRAWRRWRRIDASAIDDADKAELLRDVHAALARSAGETLYPATLPRLFERAPYLAPLRATIESTFAASWQRFYGGADVAEPSASDVLAMLREAADRERRVPC
jgi:mxaA protein